jgi:quercetin dioxygenase-like cupin family protein
MGRKYLVSRVHVATRLREHEAPGEATVAAARDHQTVGYVIEGRARLHVEGQMALLEPGNSSVVPRGADHHCRILDTFTVVEATYPSAHAHGRDEGGGERKR